MTHHELCPLKRLDKDVARMNRRLQSSRQRPRFPREEKKSPPQGGRRRMMDPPARTELSCRLRDEQALYTIMGNGGGYGIIRARAA